MLKKLLPLIIGFLCTFSVVVPQTYARLGESGEDVISRNKPRAEKVDTYSENGFTVYVFQYTKGFYSIGILNGVVEVETYAVWDDYSFPANLVATEMSNYGTQWDEMVAPMKNNKAFMTTDGQFYVVMGEMLPMGVKKAVTFYTKTWRDSGKKL